MNGLGFFAAAPKSSDVCIKKLPVTEQFSTMFGERSSYLTSDYETNDFWSGAEAAIPALQYPALCNWVYCWLYSKTKFCDECKKLFCLDHMENHFCFQEENTVASIIVSSSYNESTEVITL